MIKIAPSLLAADFCNMEQGVRMMERARSGLSPLRHYGRSFRSQYFVWFSDDFKTE